RSGLRGRRRRFLLPGRLALLVLPGLLALLVLASRLGVLGRRGSAVRTRRRLPVGGEAGGRCRRPTLRAWLRGVTGAVAAGRRPTRISPVRGRIAGPLLLRPLLLMRPPVRQLAVVRATVGAVLLLVPGPRRGRRDDTGVE